jgi:DNA-binding MarR family transcriptional regulator
MTVRKPGSRRAQAKPTRWLTADEEAAWRTFARLLTTLPWALECQLQRDAGLSFIEYHALAMLSETPDHTRRMSDLALVTNASLSRLSHLIKRLEDRGFVRREPDPSDGRYTNAILTKSGYDHLVAAAPAHVAAVRRYVIDPLTKDQVQQLHETAVQMLHAIEPTAEQSRA